MTTDGISQDDVVAVHACRTAVGDDAKHTARRQALVVPAAASRTVPQATLQVKPVDVLHLLPTEAGNDVQRLCGCGDCQPRTSASLQELPFPQNAVARTSGDLRCTQRDMPTLTSSALGSCSHLCS